MIQYYHNNGTVIRKTIALEVPKKDTLMEMLKLGQRLIRLNIGEANVHPQDQYIKKIGRLISTQNIKEKQYKLDSIELRDDYMLFYLSPQNSRFKKSVLLRVFYNKSTVHFLEG